MMTLYHYLALCCVWPCHDVSFHHAIAIRALLECGAREHAGQNLADVLATLIPGQDHAG